MPKGFLLVRDFSFLKSFILAAYFYGKSHSRQPYFSNLAFHFLFENGGFSDDFFDLWIKWDFIQPVKDLSFEDSFLLDVITFPEFKFFFDESLVRLDNWDEHVLSPLGPYDSFSYYIKMFAGFYKRFKLDFYISKLKEID